MPVALTADPRANRLLAVLPDAELARCLPHLEAIELPLGKVLYESGIRLGHVVFPTTAIVSLLSVMEDGSTAEIAVVGNEGWSAFRFSWVAIRRPAGRWCRAAARASGCGRIC
jgi:hypothetical protein